MAGYGDGVVEVTLTHCTPFAFCPCIIQNTRTPKCLNNAIKTSISGPFLLLRSPESVFCPVQNVCYLSKIPLVLKLRSVYPGRIFIASTILIIISVCLLKDEDSSELNLSSHVYCHSCFIIGFHCPYLRSLKSYLIPTLANLKYKV